MKQTKLFEFELKKAIPVKANQAFSFKRIRDMSWDFRETPASTGVYGIHPYPAMFHFLVVRKLLNNFSGDGDWVFDPFMGSGVVAVESFINNRNFVGYDINPLAVLISKVRATPIPQEQLLEALKCIEENYHRNYPELIDFHNINYWFDGNVIRELSRLRKAIFSLKEERLRDFFKVVFSETVRKVSRTKHNEFKLLRTKSSKNNSSVIKSFRNIGLKNISLLVGFYKDFTQNCTKVILEERNILEASPLEDNSIDLVITSPPYGDSRTTVAYGQFSRLSLRWLGLEEKVDKTSLGSQSRNITHDLPSSLLYEFIEKIANKDKKRAREVFSYYKDLFSSIKLISKKVKPKGHICFVVGNRRVKGEELPTDKISADFFKSVGFKHQKTIIRAISNKRMPAENAPSNVKGEKNSTMRYEYIVILKKI